MSTIDLIVCLMLLLALWRGWRQGVIVQLCTLAGIVAGIWLAVRMGAEVGSRLGLEPRVAPAGGFAAVFLVVMLCVALAARLLRAAFRTVGLGGWDAVLGIAVAAVKYLLVLGVLFSAFDALNRDWRLVDDDELARSRCYGPAIRFAESLAPVVEWARDRAEGWPAAEPDEEGKADERPV